MTRKKRPLAIPFVATLAACGGGGTTTHEPETPSRNPPAQVVRPALPKATPPSTPGVKDVYRFTQTIGPDDYYQDPGDGSECSLMQSMSCPEHATCNPPPPMRGECAGQGVRPTGWEESIHLPATFYAGQYGCSYTQDVICPTPKSGGGACSEQVSYTLSCTTNKDPQTNKLTVSIPAFAYGNVMGECFYVEAFECEGQACNQPPPAKTVDCSQ